MHTASLRTLAAPALVLALAGLAAAQTEVTTPPETIDASRVPFYKLLRPGLAVAGQPTPETLAQLAELGFRTVVNLRTDSEPGVTEERAVVEGQGLRYVHVPVTPQSFSQADNLFFAEAAKHDGYDPDVGSSGLEKRNLHLGRMLL